MDNYTKLRIIGSGSFGTVWLIRSKSNQRNYVLKEIPLSTVPEKEREFMLNEVHVLSRLRHKNVIRYKEVFFNNGFLCISMEFAHEGDLSNKIEKQCGRMFLKEQIIDWFIQLCLSVKYIHGMNILHRDIKLQNIFLAKGNIIKLGDFGIARVLHNTLDHAQTVIGTPYYLSPEICQRQLYNHKSDIWAMGCVLYELVTLRHPFEAADFAGLVLKILHADYAPIPESHGPLLGDLVKVLLRVKATERPSAKQILHIPAMQPYVDKVLSRGRTQRSESVSYAAASELPRERNVWRKPDLMPAAKEREVTAGKRRCVSQGNDREKERCKKDIWVSPQHAEMRNVERPCAEVACNGKENGHAHSVVRGQKKRASSEVFVSDNEGNQCVQDSAPSCITKYEETFCDGEIFEDEKENLSAVEVQRGHSKQRAYSTSIVHECVERRPLTSLNKHAATPFCGETYDVVPCTRQIRGETYTVFKNQRPVGKNPNVGCVNEAKTNKTRRKKPEKQPPKLDGQKQKDFVKILLTQNRFNVGNVSPVDSLSSYTRAMRSHLEETLGSDVFIAVYECLAYDVKKEDSIDVMSKLFEIMGDQNIIYVPLILQLIQCENSFS